MKIFDHINLIIIILTIGLFAVSCEKDGLKTADPNVAVIESYIVPGQLVQVQVSRQLVFAEGDTTVKFLKGLQVKLTSGSESENCLQLNDSIYTSQTIRGTVNSEYSIEIIYNGKTITAQTLVPTKPEGLTISDTSLTVPTFGQGMPPMGQFEPVVVSWSNPNLNYYMLVVENMEEDPVVINNGRAPKRIFRNTPTQSNEQRIEFMNFTYLGKHRIILYKLNPDYAALYERNGSSSLDIAPPPSNISGGLGIFTGINADTVYINVIQ